MRGQIAKIFTETPKRRRRSAGYLIKKKISSPETGGRLIENNLSGEEKNDPLLLVVWSDLGAHIQLGALSIKNLEVSSSRVFTVPLVVVKNLYQMDILAMENKMCTAKLTRKIPLLFQTKFELLNITYWPFIFTTIYKQFTSKSASPKADHYRIFL